MRETPSYEQSICDRCGTMREVNETLHECPACIDAECLDQDRLAREATILREAGIAPYDPKSVLIMATREDLARINALQKRSK